jgi:hypothetical protein
VDLEDALQLMRRHKHEHGDAKVKLTHLKHHHKTKVEELDNDLSETHALHAEIHDQYGDAVSILREHRGQIHGKRDICKL